jgi:hypothetical protein
MLFCIFVITLLHNVYKPDLHVKRNHAVKQFAEILMNISGTAGNRLLCSEYFQHRQRIFKRYVGRHVV